MQIVLDEIEDSIYGDIILSPKEMEKMRFGEMVDACVIFKKKRCYLGVRLRGVWDYEDEQDEREDEDF